MEEQTQRLITLGLGWLAYFVVHSWLASTGAKRLVADRRPRFMPYYRLAYNLLAVLLLLPLVYVSLTGGGEWLWRWRGSWWWVANGLAMLAAGGFLWTMRYYSGAAFIGTAQWRSGEHGVEDPEGFRISPLHRHVRHPWYSLGLVILWTRDMDPARLLATVLVTTYLVVGSRLEERKLIELHGDAYRTYRRKVPALIPLPWRRLSREEAHRLARVSRRT